MSNRDGDTVVHLSPTAKSGLRLQAFRLGYVTSLNHRNYRGLSAYIDALATCNFEDTRPDDVRELHEAMLASNYFPFWSAEEYRPQTRLHLYNTTIAKLYAFGITNDIINPRRVVMNPPAVSVIGYVLEAIGINWLTPVDPPKLIRSIDSRDRDVGYSPPPVKHRYP